MTLLINCLNNINKAIYGVIILLIHCFNKVNNFILGKTTPARLGPIENLTFREKYEAELILLSGVGVIILLFIFAFCIVGQMDPYTNGCLV